MKPWNVIAAAIGLMTCLTFSADAEVPATPADKLQEGPPNIVVIFTDDQGYSDIGVFGAEGFKTPRLDQMAQQGMRFTDFHVAAKDCSPSRAALLTGSYPVRVSVPRVLFPADVVGLNPNELTIAELLKGRGYATKMVGKWHLGHHPGLYPTDQGFDSFFGLPYSNDMSPRPEHNPNEVARKWPELRLMRDAETIEIEPDQRFLTKRYTEEATQFIETNKERPFFLYLAHAMPHVPLFASPEFAGKSARGPYGDVIQELDWSVGQLLDKIDQLGLGERTLVVFTSDNGPWLIKGPEGGSAKPLRAGKGTVFEGGVRVPCIMRWTSRIPAGAVCDELASTMDLLPTAAKLSGAALPNDRVIDGKDIRPLMFNAPGAKTPWDVMYFYAGRQLAAVRSGPWKLHVANSPGAQLDLPALYNLTNDLGEQRNVAAEHPDIVQRLQTLAEQARQDIGDGPRQGKNARPPGHAKDVKSAPAAKTQN